MAPAEADAKCADSPADLFRSFTAAFNDGDAAALAALFGPDANFINIYGERMTGRIGIERGHAAAFRSRLSGAELLMLNVDTRAVSPTDAILYGTWELSQPGGIDPTTAVAPGTGTLTGVAACVDGAWRLEAAANVRSSTPPS